MNLHVDYFALNVIRVTNFGKFTTDDQQNKNLQRNLQNKMIMFTLYTKFIQRLTR